MRKSDKSRSSGMWRAVLIAVLFAAAFAAVAVFISCAVAVGADDPDSAATVGATLSLMLTAVFGGIVSSKTDSAHRPVCGIVFGVAALSVIFLVGIIIKTEISSFTAAICAPAFVILAAFGGIIGAGRTKARRRKRTYRSSHTA
ncbi:MAG: TIGR04086 family membrane protein [Clostridia bacterium]|nr:TIGR04086 family membrane protein [Clostridia bacterium]